MYRTKKKTVLAALLTVCLIFSMAVSGAAETGGNWESFRNSETNVAVVETALPVSLSPVYTAQLKAADDWNTNVSEPLLYQGQVCVAVGDSLVFLDAEGQEVRRLALSSAIGYNCRIRLAGDFVIVPLSDASIQTIDLATGETVWQTQPVLTTDEGGNTQYHSIQSAIAFDGEALYVPTVCFDVSTYAAVRGEVLCIDAATGDVRWQYDNTAGGYNWSGAVVRGGKVVIAGSDGCVRVLDADSGALLAEQNLSASVNAAISFADGYYYAVSSDGTLHQFTVGDDGTIAVTGSVNFAYSSTSTAAVYDGKAYVGGLLEESVDWSNPGKGVLAVIDVENMTVAQKGEPPAEVKASPLLSVGEDGVNAYFTCNAYPGALYCLTDGEIVTAFTPQASAQNYCLTSPICDDDGVIYYWNDSGTLFALSDAEEVLLAGDINGDGKVTTADARLLLRMAVGLDELTEQALTAGDMDNSGTITTSDARAVLRIAVGLES